MMSSLVDAERCARVKKRVYMGQVDEFEHSSGPLSGIVLNTVMNSIPFTRPLRPLKEGYVNDLTRDGGISPCALMLGLLYIKRLSLTNPAYLTSVTPRELFLVAMVIASKYMNDEGELEALTNSDWAKIGSLTKTALDDLERSFLEAIDWRLYVSMEEYYNFVTSIEGQVALAEASRRGWFTYTDLTAIWDASNMQALMMTASKQTAKVVCGGAAIYLMCVATLLTASHPHSGDPFSLTSVTPSQSTPLPLTNATNNHLDFDVALNSLSSSNESFETINAFLDRKKPPDIFEDFVGGVLYKGERTASDIGGDSGTVRTVTVGGCDDEMDTGNFTDECTLDDNLRNLETRKVNFDHEYSHQCGGSLHGLLLLLNLTSSLTNGTTHATSCDQNKATPTEICDQFVTTPIKKSCDCVMMATPPGSTYYVTESNRHCLYGRDSQTGWTSFENKYCKNEARTTCNNNSNGQSMTSSLLDHHGNTVSSPKVDSSFELNFHLKGTFHWPPVNRTPVSNFEWNPINYSITESVLLYTQSLLAY